MRPEQVVEATLFASEGSLTVADMARADEDLTPSRAEEAVQTLRSEYEDQERSFQIYRLGDGYQILTRPEYAPYLERFDSVPKAPGLSSAAVETLAIVAYRQPISRVEVEEIRGVSSSSVLNTLRDWELIEVVGRGEGLGRPLLYGTTERFLDHFGFQSLDDLPTPEDLPVTLRDEEPAAGEDASGETDDAGADGAADGGGSAEGESEPAGTSGTGAEEPRG